MLRSRLAQLACMAAPLIALTGCDPKPEAAPPAKSGPPTDETDPDVGDPGSDGEPDPMPDPYAQAPIAPSSPHAFGILDMLGMERIGSPTPSPDGKSIAVVNRYTDMGQDRGRTDLWIVDAATGDRRRLTTHPAGESNPVWSEDGGSILFLSDRGLGSQIFRLKADKEEGEDNPAEPVTEFDLDITSFRVIPGSADSFVISADVWPDCDNVDCSAKRLEEKQGRTDSAQIYDGVFVRHWDTWKDGRRSHLLALNGDGTATDLMAGMQADCPSKPFGGLEDYAVSPDGKTVVFSARDVGREEPWSTNFDLFSVPTAGGEPAKLTENPAWDAHPVFSDDGKTLAYTAMARAGFEADRMVLHTLALEEGASPQPVSQDWDRSVRDFAFAPDGGWIIVAQDLGETKLFRLEEGSSQPEPIEGATTGTNGSPMRLGDSIAFVHDDLDHPAELYTIPAGGGEATKLTAFNDERLGPVSLGEYEQFSFKGAKGDTVYGWIVKPADFDESKTYPLAFLIHGGPQGSFGNHFHYRWNPQFYAGAGYVAVMIDFHGSTGYGQGFTDAIRGDWGGKPLEDLKKGLAYVESNYAFVDKDKVCALGASYGGYMINWIAGNWPNRFSCLINHDGIFDQRSMYYSTEELWFPEWEHGGPYYDAQKGYERHNPSAHVKKWKTPMLVVHGLEDHRVPLEQGLATFNALQRQGIESRFMYFPDENHWVLRPNNSKRWHDEVQRWLDEHLLE